MWLKIRKILVWVFCYILVACTAITLLAYAKYCKATEKMEELERDLDRRIGLYERKTFPHPPLTGPAVPGNAETYYFIAENIIENPDKMLHGKLWDAYNYPDRQIDPDVQAYLERNSAVIEFIQKGANAEYYKPSRFRKELDENKKIFDMIDVFKFALFQVRYLEKHNQLDDALKLDIDIIRYGNDNMCRSGNFAVTLAINSNALNELSSCIQENKFTENGINLLLDYLSWLVHNEPDLQENWEIDLLRTEFWFNEQAKDYGFFPSPPPPTGYKTMPMINKTDFTNTWMFYINVSNEIKRIDSLPTEQAKNTIARANIRLDNLLLETFFYSFGRIENEKILDSYVSIKQQYMEYLTNLRGLYVLTALKLYKAKYAKYPEKLEDLSPEIIPEIPLDPFTEKSFIYKIIKDQDFILYGAGEDCVDNGGIDMNPKGGPDILIYPRRDRR